MVSLECRGGENGEGRWGTVMALVGLGDWGRWRGDRVISESMLLIVVYCVINEYLYSFSYNRSR